MTAPRLRRSVHLRNGRRIVILSAGPDEDPFLFLEIAHGDETRGNAFLGPKDLDRLVSALQCAVVHLRRRSPPRGRSRGRT